MAFQQTPRRVETVVNEESRLRFIDQNFDDLFKGLNNASKQIDVYKKFLDVKRGAKLSNLLYRVSEHAIQVTLDNNQLIDGTENIEWNVETRKDNDYYEHDNTINPDEITVKQAGWYRITLKGVTDDKTVLHVIRERNAVDTDIDESYIYLK